MTEGAEQGTRTVVCPHCKKTFTAQLMGTPSDSRRGFKCPHCRLFVPAERVEATA